MDVVIPQWGLTMEDAVLVRWLVVPGDTVSEGQAIAELEADKVDAELESPADGTVTELLGVDGETYSVGAVIARLETS